MLILFLLGLVLPLSACDRADPLAPIVTRDPGRARSGLNPPAYPDTIWVGLPVEPVPLDPILDDSPLAGR